MHLNCWNYLLAKNFPKLDFASCFQTLSVHLLSSVKMRSVRIQLFLLCSDWLNLVESWGALNLLEVVYLQAGSTVGNMYSLYAVTVSGVAYLFRLQNICAYESGSIFPQNELVECNLQTDPQWSKITCMVAASGCLVIGRHDGSISCYQLGVLDQRVPGMILLCLFFKFYIFDMLTESSSSNCGFLLFLLVNL